MIKKSMCSALLMVLCCLPVISDAAVCRAAEAAQAGSDAGFEKAKRADEGWAKLEREISGRLQSCLARLRTQRSGSLPFPSLQDMFDQLAEKICQTAIDKIKGQIPPGSDPWQENSNL